MRCNNKSLLGCRTHSLDYWINFQCAVFHWLLICIRLLICSSWRQQEIVRRRRTTKFKTEKKIKKIDLKNIFFLFNSLTKCWIHSPINFRLNITKNFPMSLANNLNSLAKCQMEKWQTKKKSKEEVKIEYACTIANWKKKSKKKKAKLTKDGKVI